MNIGPILLALSRNKIAVCLIILQMALTLAIVANSLFVVSSKLHEMNQLTGIDEEHIFTLYNQWTDPAAADLEAKLQSDLAELRALPDVADAYASGGFPLAGAGSTISVQLSAQQERPTSTAALYAADLHTGSTLGIVLIGGRWFQHDDFVDQKDTASDTPSAVVVTEALANDLFHGGPVLGKTIYLGEGKARTIVGIVKRTQGPWTIGPFIYNVIFEPMLFVAPGSFYVVRARPGRLNAAMKAVPAKLHQVRPQRILGYVATFEDSRKLAYRGQRSITIILTSVSALLLIANSLGIVGLSSHWVTQRRQQIGVRRALGARRMDIVLHFLTENLMVSASASLIGAAAAVGGNLWLVNHMALPHIETSFVLLGVVLMILLGQLSVLWPSVRAATTPPSLAARGALTPTLHLTNSAT